MWGGGGEEGGEGGGEGGVKQEAYRFQVAVDDSLSV